MAMRREKPKREKKVQNAPQDNAHQAGEPSANPPAEMTQGTFGLQKDVSKIFTSIQIPEKNDAANPPTQSIQSAGGETSPLGGPAEYRPIKIRSRKFPITQKVLLVGIILSTALLTYSFVFSPSSPPSPPQAHAEQSTGRLTAEQPAANTERSDGPASETNNSHPQIAHQPTAPAVSEANQHTQYTVQQPAVLPNRDGQAKTETASAQHTELRDEPASATPESAPKTEPVSLRLANDYFAAKDYLRAYNTCNKLSQNLTGKEFELVRDFLHLRMAICLMQKSRSDKTSELLRAVSESQSIAIKILANYNLCLLEMSSGQYLKARTRAYKTIALTGAIASDYKWALTIERDCQFFAAEAIARQALALSDADKELPKQLWYHAEEIDPLAGLDEVELQKVLNAGMERFNNGLLAPQIQAIDSGAGSQILTRWSVVSNGPGIEELIARFSSNAAIDVKWAKRTDDSIATERQPAGWNRSVVLYLPVATTQQVLSTAAGSVGLLALINDTNTVTITDPGEYYALSEHTKMLNEYSIWLWRKLLLMYSDDLRIANAHFILGVLQEQKGQASDAISEYKLVASRYPKTSFAPFALLRSSGLKTGLRDYQGATRDLKQLIDQYPENELIGQAYLNLAETTLKAGMFEQACSLYRRAYNLALTNEAKAIGALGAGKCFYQMKDYEPALEWLTIYLETVNAQQPTGQNSTRQTRSEATSGRQRIESGPLRQLKNNPDLYTAYLLLGKTHLAMGNIQQACETLEHTVQKANASDEYAEAIATLVEAQMKQGDLITALETIENIRPWSFSQEQTTRLLVLKGAILRESGLAEQAISLLNDRIQYLTNNRLKADITLELARCEIATNHLDLARAHLSEAILAVEPGPTAQSASLELADVCLKLNDCRQTITICKQLLDSSPPEQIKQKASKLLAAAYSSQKDYDKAAMALLASSYNMSQASPDRHNISKEEKTSDTSEK